MFFQGGKMAKILFEHANEFKYYKKVFHSNTYYNCLITRISFEKGDELKIVKIAKAIKEIFFILKPNIIILFPFSHLSNNLIDKTKSERIFNEVAIILEKLPILLLPFGIDKGYKIDIKDHKLNNIFRSI